MQFLYCNCSFSVEQEIEKWLAAVNTTTPQMIYKKVFTK